MSELSTERFIGNTFAEFFNAMQFLSGKMKQDIASDLEVGGTTYSRWAQGKRIPNTQYDERFIALYGIAQAEVDVLRQNTKEEILESTRLRAKVDQCEAEVYRERLLGAYLVRIERGEPPLTEIDQSILQSLVSLGVQN